MKKLLYILPLVLAAGCAQREYGSWLDQVGRPPNPPQAMSDDVARELQVQVAQLRAQAEALRVKLSQETDRVKRFAYYSEIRKIDDKIVPLERVLENAGRHPVPRRAG